MNRMHPRTLLLVLIGTVPLVVAIAAATAALLLRAGYGYLLGVVLPFVVSMLVIAVLGMFLGRAAGAGRKPEERESPFKGRSQQRDGV